MDIVESLKKSWKETFIKERLNLVTEGAPSSVIDFLSNAVIIWADVFDIEDESWLITVSYKEKAHSLLYVDHIGVIDKNEIFTTANERASLELFFTDAKFSELFEACFKEREKKIEEEMFLKAKEKHEDLSIKEVKLVNGKLEYVLSNGDTLLVDLT